MVSHSSGISDFKWKCIVLILLLIQLGVVYCVYKYPTEPYPSQPETNNRTAILVTGQLRSGNLTWFSGKLRANSALRMFGEWLTHPCHGRCWGLSLWRCLSDCLLRRRRWPCHSNWNTVRVAISSTCSLWRNRCLYVCSSTSWDKSIRLEWRSRYIRACCQWYIRLYAVQQTSCIC